MNILGLIFTFVASDAGQSLVRSALKVGGGLLVAHGVTAGADAGSLDTVIGSLMAVFGVVNSLAVHALPTTLAAS